MPTAGTSGPPDRLVLTHWAAPALGFAVQDVVIHRRTPVHWHEFHELFVVVAGTGTHTMDGVTAGVSAGSAALLLPFDLHGFSSRDGDALRLLNVAFSEQAVTGEARRLLTALADRPRSGRAGPDALRSLEADIRRLAAEEQQRSRHRGLAVSATLQRLVVDIARLAHAQPGAATDRRSSGFSAPIRSALRYVHANFSRPLSLAEVAAAAHLAPTYLSERFHAEVGEQFQRYLRRQRLRFAAALLASTDASVTEVCHAAGFNSLSHFARAFRDEFGCSATEYRRSASGCRPGSDHGPTTA